jgi:uncharacterized membrane protein YhaH (DUF805 family)
MLDALAHEQESRLQVLPPMPIPFTCPHCGLYTSAAGELAGQATSCSECGTPVTIPLVDTINPYQSPQTAIASFDDSEPTHDGLVWLLFSFEGRITRRPWWYVSIPVFVAYYGYLNEIFIAFAASRLPADSRGTAILVLSAIATVFVTWIDVAVTSKRFHDRDKSGWWYLVRCIPYFGHLWTLIECGFMPGTYGVNTFGPDPKPET